MTLDGNFKLAQIYAGILRRYSCLFLAVVSHAFAAVPSGSVSVVKTDTPGFLDVKLTVIAKEPAPWLAAFGALGTVADPREDTGWQICTVATGAKLRDLEIRVHGYIGAPTADVRIGFIGADRIVSDGVTEIPDVSMAEAPRIAGPPSKETLMSALKDALRTAANA